MKAKRNQTTINKSIINKLKNQNKITDQLLVKINQLSIEDLIAIKFELSAGHINNRLYGFNLWQKSKILLLDK